MTESTRPESLQDIIAIRKATKKAGSPISDEQKEEVILRDRERREKAREVYLGARDAQLDGLMKAANAINN
jgi:hypothetical protein